MHMLFEVGECLVENSNYANPFLRGGGEDLSGTAADRAKRALAGLTLQHSQPITLRRSSCHGSWLEPNTILKLAMNNIPHSQYAHSTPFRRGSRIRSERILVTGVTFN